MKTHHRSGIHRFFRRHRYVVRGAAYALLILASFQLGKAWVRQSVFDGVVGVLFAMMFLWVKFYEKFNL